MTDITRIFNYETRSFKNVDKKYSGQINDASSTTLHFIYEPIDFLKESLDGDKFIPYIMFAVYRKDGTPYTYGPTPIYDPETKSESPVFDGYTFTIPWEVTHNATSQKVEYQLFFVRNGVTFDPKTGVANLSSTDYMLSSIDGIAFKKSITCSKKQKCDCPSMTPNSEPTVVGYINLWKDYGVVMPIESYVDPDSGQLKIDFHTYNGEKDQTLMLDVAPLVDGKVPAKFLPIDKDWTDPTDETVPSSRLVRETLDNEFTKKTMAVALWDSTAEYSMDSVVVWQENLYISIKIDDSGLNVGHDPSEEESEWWSTVTEYDMILTSWTTSVPEEGAIKKVPCERLVLEALAGKIDTAKILTIWSSSGITHDYVPSAKLVKATVDLKLDRSQLTALWADAPSDVKIPSEKLVKSTLDEKVEKADVITEWSEERSEQKIPTEKMVLDKFDTKTDKENPIPEWDPATEYHNNSVVVYGNTMYISKADYNKGVNPALESSTRWWETVGNGGGTGDYSKKYIDVLGDGVNSVFRVRHALGSEDIFYTMRSLTSTFELSEGMFVDADVTVEDANTVNVRFYEPIPENSIMITIGTGLNEGSFTTTIQSATETEFEITHNFATKDFFASFREPDTGRIVKADVYAITPNKAKIVLSAPPVDGLHVVLSPNACDYVTLHKYYFEQESPSNRWEIHHNMGIPVQVQVFDDDGNELTGRVTQNSNLLDVVIEFNHAHTGYAVVR